MSESSPTFAGHVGPAAAWAAVKNDAGAFLVDVRSEAEWTFVGAPDLEEADKPLWLISWRTFPGMRRNDDFESTLAQHIDHARADAVYFLCRSGSRSSEAAQAMASAGLIARSLQLVNVAEGFCGDLDGHGRRGAVNGWRARGLPWRQS